MKSRPRHPPWNPSHGPEWSTTGRGVHSATSRLNLSHFVTKSTPRIPQKVLALR
jgi:hypothetical protein